MNNLLKKLAWPVFLAPAVYLALTWRRIPETVALHFDLHGNPDRYGNKKELLGLAAILIVMNVFIYFLLTNIYRIDPKKYAIENKDRLNKIAFAVAVFMSGILCMIIYTALSGNIQPNIGLIFSATGLLFAIIGNYMPNLKPNYFAGLRLPWTLENPENWKKTHAMAGKLWFAGGMIIAIICLFLSPVPAMILFFITLAVLIIIPCVFSYRLYRQHKAAG